MPANYCRGHRSTTLSGRIASAAAAVLLAACTGPQSALDPASPDAERVADLLVLMSAGAAIVWILVVGLSFYATRRRENPADSSVARRLIVIGGAVVPVVVLAALLGYGLAPLPAMLAMPPPGGPVLEVTAEQWWWRIHYLLPDGRSFDTANEIRLPVGERVEVRLDSADVIHSFWLPSIAGKMDAIPGRRNRIALEPTRTGVFRGACAEYCGRAHARMNFDAVVLSPEDFARWTEAQLADAAAPPAAQERGAFGFLAAGCGACHRIRGTAADGRVGPDLTHIASRTTIGAGMLPVQIGELQRWIELTDRVKPGVHMPAFNMLPPEDVRAIASYLASLK